MWLGVKLTGQAGRLRLGWAFPRGGREVCVCVCVCRDGAGAGGTSGRQVTSSL